MRDRDNTKKGRKKVFWSVFIIIFIIVAIVVGINVYNFIYESQVISELEKWGIDPSELTEEELDELLNPKESDIKITDAVFECENNNSVQSRGYIILLGLGNHNKDTYYYENSLMLEDSKVKGILTYDYDENLLLQDISIDFIEKVNEFLASYDVEELIIVGTSAGGVVAAYSANELNFSGPVELHTIASPLKGYNLKGWKERFIGDRTGFEREIGLGFESFITPSDNVKVYHHKEITTVEDEYSLLSWCGSYVQFCDILEIQYNNIEGSKEFYYDGYDHEAIMNHVLRMIIACHQ